MVWILVTLWDNFRSVGVVRVFVECQFQGFGLIWFMRWDGLDFWKLMRLGFFLYGPINSKEAWNHFCMLLVGGILTKSHF